MKIEYCCADMLSELLNGNWFFGRMWNDKKNGFDGLYIQKISHGATGSSTLKYCPFCGRTVHVEIERVIELENEKPIIRYGKSTAETIANMEKDNFTDASIVNMLIENGYTDISIANKLFAFSWKDKKIKNALESAGWDEERIWFSTQDYPERQI